MCYKAYKIVSVNKIITLVLFIAFSQISIINATIYEVPLSAYSLTCGDMDLDGDNDIIIGHNFNSNSKWGGLFVFENDAKGNLQFKDSIYQYSWQTNIYMENITNDQYPDIIARHSYNEAQYMTILEGDSIGFQSKYYPMDYGINDFTTGDIDGDGDIDIVFYSNSGYFWGYMKNDGTGQFSSPIYYDEFDVPLGSIACGDLNNDGVDEVVVSCSPDKLLIYSSGWLIDEITYFTDYSEIWVRDIDKDGNNEIIVAGGVLGAYTELLVFSKNEAKGFSLTYSKRISEAMTRLSIADLNRDYYPEIVYNCSYYYPNSDYEKWHTYILYNENGVSFSDPVDFQTYFGDTPNYTSTIRSFVADIDGNGLKDIVALNSSYAFENDVTILFQTEAGDFVQEPQTGIENHNLVSGIELYQNYPNPFNNETKIQFSLVKASQIELNIFNSKGEFVQNLVSSNLNKGKHSFSFKADNINSGIYFYKLSIEGVAKETKKMLYLK